MKLRKEEQEIFTCNIVISSLFIYFFFFLVFKFFFNKNSQPDLTAASLRNLLIKIIISYLLCIFYTLALHFTFLEIHVPLKKTAALFLTTVVSQWDLHVI